MCACCSLVFCSGSFQDFVRFCIQLHCVTTIKMSEEGFLDAQVEFSLRLLKELGVDSTVSTVLSPISIVLALSLAYAGADGETRQEFDDVFAKGNLKINSI